LHCGFRCLQQGAAERHPTASAVPARHDFIGDNAQRLVAESITAATGVMRFSGKPDLAACSRINASRVAL